MDLSFSRMLFVAVSFVLKRSLLIAAIVFTFFFSVQAVAQTRAAVVDLGDGLFVVIPVKGVSAPGSVDATQSGTNSLTITWSASNGATSYRLERYVNGNWVLVYSGSNLSYTVNGLPTGNLLFRVAACNDTDCGAPSEDFTVKVVVTQSIDYVYDALGRLKQVTDPNNGNRVYNYDKAGNRTSVSAQ